MDSSQLSKGERTRLALIAEARRLFAQKGYEGTGIDEIVGSLGLTSGVFYANFKSKEELLKVVLQTQIEFAKQNLLKLKDGETDEEWIDRALKFYLSRSHRNEVSTSCPMTTMAQELQKLKLTQATGLQSYIEDFETTLRSRLDGIQKGLGRKAPSVISLCVGSILTARTLKSEDSDRYLQEARKTIREIVFAHMVHVSEKPAKVSR